MSNAYLLSVAVYTDPNAPTPITKSTTSIKPTVPSKTTISSDGTTYFTVSTQSTTVSTEGSTIAATTNLTVGSQQTTESTMLLGSTLNLKFSTIKSTEMPLIPTTLKTLSHISAMPQFNFHQHLASPLMPGTVNTPLQITL